MTVTVNGDAMAAGTCCAAQEWAALCTQCAPIGEPAITHHGRAAIEFDAATGKTGQRRKSATLGAAYIMSGAMGSRDFAAMPTANQNSKVEYDTDDLRLISLSRAAAICIAGVIPAGAATSAPRDGFALKTYHRSTSATDGWEHDPSRQTRCIQGRF